MKLRRTQLVIALLCLAGCQAPQQHGPIPTGAGDATAAGAGLPAGPKFAAGAPKSPLLPQQPGLPTAAFTGYPGDGYTRPGNVPDFMQQAGGDCTPLPTATFGPWRPPGIGGTWPPDEYICDGGGSPQTVVRTDWRIEGLKPEETIAHFETIDGRTVVEPTNKVCIYAPRFAAVRRVDTPFDGHQLEEASGIAIREGLHQANEANLARSAMQPVEPIGAIEDKQGIALVKQQPGIDLSNRIGAGAVQDRVKPYADLLYIRSGVFQEEEKAVLAQRIQAAITWTSDQGVQVTLSGRRATPVIGDQRASAVYEIDVPNHPRLQICKIASTDNAQPGETVDFTIRFDNIGDQKMGNVTIVDNLTTRLEYVPDSKQSSVKSAFSTQPNEVGSLVLRWEIADPLAPGQGGVIRFQCKVR